MTRCGRRPLKKTSNISATTGPILLRFETYAHTIKLNVMETLNKGDLSQKMTPCGRRPQKLKLGISQKPLVQSCLNLKRRVIGSKRMLWKL